MCIEDKNTATLLLKDDRVVTAPVKSLLDAFPECEEENPEKYLLSLCSPTLVVQCIHMGFYFFCVCSECAIHSHTICNTSCCCLYHHNFLSCFVYTRICFVFCFLFTCFSDTFPFACLDQMFWHYLQP